jgi:hypothetical protein
MPQLEHEEAAHANERVHLNELSKPAGRTGFMFGVAARLSGRCQELRAESSDPPAEKHPHRVHKFVHHLVLLSAA